MVIKEIGALLEKESRGLEGGGKGFLKIRNWVFELSRGWTGQESRAGLVNWRSVYRREREGMNMTPSYHIPMFNITPADSESNDETDSTSIARLSYHLDPCGEKSTGVWPRLTRWKFNMVPIPSSKG